MLKLKTKQKQNKTKRGFTLIEILLVVGFIAIAGVVVYSTFNKVQTGNLANTEARNIQTLRAGIKGLYGAKQDFTGLTNTVARQAKLVPENMVGSGAADIVSGFGTPVTVTSFAAGFGTNPIANNAFTISYTGVPSSACSKLVSAIAPSFNRVTIGTTVVRDTVATGEAFDIAGAAAACDVASGAVDISLISI